MAGRVLLVESDEALRGNIVKALRARGIGVDAFGGAEEVIAALERGASWTRALIALDLEGTDGATLASIALSHLPELDLTFVTGGVDAAVLCRAHALGGVLWRPIGLGLLCERLAQPARRSGVTRRVRAEAPRRRTGEG